MKFKAPFPVNRHADELHFTYLDTVGRPVLVATKTNLVEAHIQDFEVGDFVLSNFIRGLVQKPHIYKNNVILN